MHPFKRILIIVLAGFAGAVAAVVIQQRMNMPYDKMITLVGGYAAAMAAWIWLKRKEGS